MKAREHAEHLVHRVLPLLGDHGTVLIGLRAVLGVAAFVAVAAGATALALSVIGVGILVDVGRAYARRYTRRRLSGLAVAGEQLADRARPNGPDGGRDRESIVRLTNVLEWAADELSRYRAAGARFGREAKPEVDRLAVTTQEMAAASQEMAATIDQISGDTAENAESLQRATTAAEQVSGALREIAQGAREAVELNSGVRELGEKQRDKMDGVSGAVAELARDISAASEQVHDLAESSERIGGFVETIQGITRQTELLALNASIEAARAGEHGRGFAVVAEEVRKLADGASTAAVDIRAVIEETVEAIDDAERMLAACSASGTVVTEGVEDATSGFEMVVEQMQVADEHMAIAQAGTGEIEQQIDINVRELEEVTRGTSELAAAIEQMSSSSQEIAAGLGETAAASDSLAHLFENTFEKFDEGLTTYEGANGGENARDAKRAGRANDPREAERIHSGG